MAKMDRSSDFGTDVRDTRRLKHVLCASRSCIGLTADSQSFRQLVLVIVIKDNICQHFISITMYFGLWTKRCRVLTR